MPEAILNLLPKLPALALAIGICLGLAGLWPASWKKISKSLSKNFIQISIILLGFWISLPQLLNAGLSALILSTGAIIVVLALSTFLAKLLRTEPTTSTLLTAGTAICGGSAIAATGSAINASATAIAASTAIVFILNALGVYIYPPLGHMLNLSDAQFGAWAAVGVHDVAGVVAAAKSFSDSALADATVIKLTRVLWIVPVALTLRHFYLKSSRNAGNTDIPAAQSPFPWFIVIFIIACSIRAALDHTLDTQGRETTSAIATYAKHIATILLSLALLLIGTGISLPGIKALGWRPLAHGTILWISTSALALLAVKMWL